MTISFAAADVDGSVTTGAQAAHGSVTVADGQITYVPDADFNGSDTLTVTTTDNDGASVTKTVFVTVSDVNDAPTLEVLSTATVDEDGSKTISFSAADSDGSVTTTSQATHGSVTVADGQITYVPDADFNGSDTLTVTTIDDDGVSVEKTIDISVSDTSVDENSAAGTVVATLSAEDVDAGESFTYELVGASDQFTVDGNQIKVKEGAELDYETNTTHDVRVRVTDSGGGTFEEDVTIQVNDINETPPGITLTGSRGNDTLEGGAGDDVVSGGSGDDIFIFNAFDGQDSYHGGGGWTDAIELNTEAYEGTDLSDNPWTIEVDGEILDDAAIAAAEGALALNPDSAGVITMADGSELVFDGVEEIKW